MSRAQELDMTKYANQFDSAGDNIHITFSFNIIESIIVYHICNSTAISFKHLNTFEHSLNSYLLTIPWILHFSNN